MARLVPTAKLIAARIAGTMETALQVARPLVNPLAISRSVRSEKGSLSIAGRALAKELRENHDHLSWWGRMYFADTAEEEFILRHASMWDVERRPATLSLGTLEVTGTAGTDIVVGTEFAQTDGLVFESTIAAQIAVDGTASVTVRALASGPESNLAAEVALSTVEPDPNISEVRVGDEGMLGGADEESLDSLQDATLERIRQRAHGGAGFDYPYWLGRSYAVKAVKVLPDWIGRGSVGVAPVMLDGANVFGRAPSAVELEAMIETLGRPGTNEGVRPVTAYVVMVPTVAEVQPLQLRLRPDTASARAAVTEAWYRYIATLGDEEDEKNDSPVGATIEPSRITEALSAANGEYAHDLLSPVAAYTLDDTVFPTPGVPDFVAAP